MSFWGNAVGLIKGKRDLNNTNLSQPDSVVPEDQVIDFDFSIRSYAKESFKILITKPLSKCSLKIMRVTSFVITGLLIGIAIALLCIGILLQFGSIENTILSSLITGNLETLLPDADLSIKSAMFQWNSDTRSVEITMKRLKINDLSIPRISILPNYMESFKQQKLVAETVSIISPKINLEMEEDLKTFSFNPNFEKGGSNKSLFEPASTLNDLKGVFRKDTKIKLVNAAVSVIENGTNWNFKNVYCEYNMGDAFPNIIDASIILPDKKYSNFSIKRSVYGNKSTYDVRIESLNPFALNRILNTRNTPLDERILSLIDGYNLPISGNIVLNFDGKNFLGGRFNLNGSSGAIKLPVKNSLSLNLGKKIDNGSVSGYFSENSAVINSINIAYGNSWLQLTGIEMPLSDYKFLDIANINGTLSLSNVDIREMETILPENISKSTVPTFKNYLPGFRLELFKVDLKGPITFGNRTTSEDFIIGQGIFNIKNAKIPLGEHTITDVNAVGCISDDGFDIKLASANFGNVKINSGVFFLSKKDNSWIGKVNADVVMKDISLYADVISHRLSALPIEKLNIEGTANFDMKLVKIQDDQLLKRGLPFRIIEGSGTIKADDNSGEFNVSWGEKGIILKGDVSTGKNSINLKIEEDFANHSGVGSFSYVSNSDFLEAMIPGFRKICDGDFELKVDTSWYGDKQKQEIALKLKNATMTLPIIGEVKKRKDDGIFTATIINKNDTVEFSKMNLETKSGKIHGSMVLDKNGDIVKCILDKFELNGNSAKINVIKDGANKILMSAIGDKMNISSTLSVLKQLKKDTILSVYIDLKEAAVSNIHVVRNIKGNLNIMDGKILDGACYAVIRKDTTLALVARDMEGTNDNLVSLSVSDAGEFMKYLRITDTIVGGNINIVTKASRNAGNSLSGAFEMNDFIVTNNIPLTKLICLSSTNFIQNLDGPKVGFNFSDGNFVIADNQIKISGRAIGPLVGISYDGTYDRMSDGFSISGISVPLSLLNTRNSDESLAANYYLSGSLGMPVLSVKPLKIVHNETLREIFGKMLPIAVSTGAINNEIGPSDNSSPDPFSNSAFDQKAANNPKDTENIENKQSIDKKFGVKITRGFNKT